MYRRSSEPTDVGRVMETAEQTSAYVSVADFYAGKSVLMTGVTGFLGKVFLEKLLYSCKDIDKVYVLIRDKKGKNAKQRIEEVINKPLFSRLKEERPDDFNKVIAIAGDIDHPDLGISMKDKEILLQKVSVVFHVAATIRLNEELKVAVNTNVRGTKYVLHLCQRMKNIKAFVHVSTAYCNTDKQILEEKVYPPPVELSEVQKFLEQSNHDNEQIKALLKGRPNTYTFTKALTETYVAENCGNISTVIIRPAIVSASLREPLAGWVDNWSGATGMMAAIMKGGVRVVLADGDNVLDLIPVDYVANLTIVAAARCSSSDNVAVYNSCTSSCNPITLSNMLKYLKTEVSKNEYDGSRITLTFTKNKCAVSTLTFLLQTTPAYLADLFLRATGKQPIYMKIQSKVIAARDILEFFTSNSWEMKVDRTRALHASLSAEDRHQFPCDPSDINWDEYMAVYTEGINRFSLTERVKSRLVQARTREIAATVRLRENTAVLCTSRADLHYPLHHLPLPVTEDIQVMARKEGTMYVTSNMGVQEVLENVFSYAAVRCGAVRFLTKMQRAGLTVIFDQQGAQYVRYMKIQSELIAARDILEFFTSNSWEMKVDRTRALHASLSAEDRHQFPCDPSDINWDDYMAVYTEGVNRFLLTKRV